MKFYLDEHLPPILANILQEGGINCVYSEGNETKAPPHTRNGSTSYYREQEKDDT